MGEVKPENSNSEFKHPGTGRKYYVYKKPDFSIHTILATDIDWPFPDKYFKLINTDTGTEEISTVLTQ